MNKSRNLLARLEELLPSDSYSHSHYIFHGTSDIYLESIKKSGLVSKSGKVYVSGVRDISFAMGSETVKGNEYRKGVGGNVIIITLARDHEIFDDVKWDYDRTYSPSYDTADAFTVQSTIPFDAVVKIEQVIQRYGREVVTKVHYER